MGQDRWVVYLSLGPGRRRPGLLGGGAVVGGETRGWGGGVEDLAGVGVGVEGAVGGFDVEGHARPEGAVVFPPPKDQAHEPSREPLRPGAVGEAAAVGEDDGEVVVVGGLVEVAGVGDELEVLGGAGEGATRSERGPQAERSEQRRRPPKTTPRRSEWANADRERGLED